jgi:uncharacterized repeat protein (TIGR02543 family)/uncharacterized repeat protein (TIGR01451 family)
VEGNDTVLIRPYNGSWVQQPIVKEGELYEPVVRLPEAQLLDMTVNVVSLTQTQVTLTITNKGSATIAASAPITFYNGGTGHLPFEDAGTVFIVTRQVGIDIFRDETVTRTYDLSTGNYNDCLIWARIMDNGSKTNFPALGAEDCDPDNNLLSGKDCFFHSITLYMPHEETSVSGSSVSVKVGVINHGGKPITVPVFVTLYRQTLPPQNYDTANRMATASTSGTIPPNDTVYVTIPISDLTPFLPLGDIVVRVNDNAGTFPHLEECDYSNNEVVTPNPALYLMMRKNATLLLADHLLPVDSIRHDGLPGNPVAALFGDTVEYRISAVNVNIIPQKVEIADTLPAFLDYIDNTWVASHAAVFSNTSDVTNHGRRALSWEFINEVAAMDTVIVTFKTTPQPGVSASQPLFANRAWVMLGNRHVPTNYTYHQGAGISIVAFSAGFGGSIYNASQQALDYHTSPHSGIVIVPDEGYEFAGWSHSDYLSLRGGTVRAQSGIMLYDTLTVYGDVELHANFVLQEYPIAYHLHGGVNAESNPPSYTVRCGTISLDAPEKANDVFLGWTGSNGDEPQPTVSIPIGSTGERQYFANYLYSGRAEDTPSNDQDSTDRIWAVKNELFVRTSKPGSILRVYSIEGVLLLQQILLQAGETKIKLPNGVYVVSLNNGVGRKVVL